MYEPSEMIMKRCLELAGKGAGYVAPNPMVGSVIVHNGKIIGEGFHKNFGDSHAEVNAINSVNDKVLLSSSTLYVNLEPCAHFGKTPPCSDLIIEKEIPEVFIACRDTNPLVAGRGIEKLRGAGVTVYEGLLESESRELNRRFFTFHEKKRPFIILKWAQTADGFLAPNNKVKMNISNHYSQVAVHQWRSEEAAIMVGKNTALSDNPQLTTRLWKGKDPIRLVLDRNLELPSHLHLFDHSVPTIIFTEQSKLNEDHLEYIQIKFDDRLLQMIMQVLWKRKIISVLVEGGSILLNSFIKANLWDEARVIIAPSLLHTGLSAPKLNGKKYAEDLIDDDQFIFYKNSL